MIWLKLHCHRVGESTTNIFLCDFFSVGMSHSIGFPTTLIAIAVCLQTQSSIYCTPFCAIVLLSSKQASQHSQNFFAVVGPTWLNIKRGTCSKQRELCSFAYLGWSSMWSTCIQQEFSARERIAGSQLNLRGLLQKLVYNLV